MNTNYKSITSFSLCLKAVGADPSDKAVDLSGLPSFMRPFVAATANLALIVKAINGSWEADWDNTSQRKWWGWFYLDKPGFRLSDSYFDFTGAYAAGGSRLCFETEEQFLFAVKHFLPYFEAFYRGTRVIRKN